MCPCIAWEAFIVKQPEVSNLADANLATIEKNCTSGRNSNRKSNTFILYVTLF